MAHSESKSRQEKDPGRVRIDWALVGVGALASAVLLFRLGRASLVDYDEGIYACLARNILWSGDWVTLTSYESVPWFDKPPLAVWLMALAMRVLGAGEFWVRAPSAVAGILVVVLTYLTARRLHDRVVALISVLPLLTAFEFLLQARKAQTDMLLTLFVCLGLYAYVRFGEERDGRWWWLFWSAFALGAMTKSMAAVVLPLAVALAVLVEGHARAILRSRDFWIGVLIAVMILLPWHLAMLVLHGRDFVDRYLLYDIVSRTVSDLQGSTGNPSYYIQRLQDRYFPWYLLAPFGVALGIRDHLSGKSRSVAPLALASVVFLLYSFVVTTKIPQYLTPMFPPLAILVGKVLGDAIRSHRSMAFGGVMLAAAAAALFSSLGSGVLQLSVLFAMVLGGSVLLVRVRHTALAALSVRDALRITLVVWVCLLLAGLGASRSRELYRDSTSAIESIARAAATSSGRAPLLSLALEEDWDVSVVGPAASFYSRRPVHVAWSREHLAELVHDGRAHEILLARKFMEGLEGRYEFAVTAEVAPFVYATLRPRSH